MIMEPEVQTPSISTNTDFIRKTRQELNCKIMRTMLNFVREQRGSDAHARLIETIGLEESYLRNENNWVSFDTYNKACEFLKHEFDDDKVMYRVGLYSFSKVENFGTIAKLGLLLLSPANIFRRTPGLANASVRFGVYRPLELSNNRMVLEFKTKSGYPFHQHNCDYRMGIFAGIPQIYGMPVARHRDLECVGRGDDRCVYEFTWQNPGTGWRGRTTTRFLLLGILLGIATIAAGWSAMSFAIGTTITAVLGLLGYALDMRRLVRDQMSLNEERADEVENALVFANQKYHEANETVTKLEAMIEATTAFNLRLVNRELYELVLDIIKNTLRYDRAMLLFKQPDGGVLADPMTVGEGFTDSQVIKIKGSDATRLSPHAAAFLSKKPVFVPRVQDHPDPVVRQAELDKGTRSFIVIPVQTGRQVVGTLKVDRVSSKEPLTREDVRILQTLMELLSVVLENSELYQELEERVRKRTAELVAAKRELESAYDDLKATQSQLLHSEKMASIGKLVAGIAHEVNNPAGIISGYLELISLHAKRLNHLLNDHPVPQDVRTEIDELISCLDPVKRGMARIKTTVIDLRNFARLDETELMPADINDGLRRMLRFFSNKTQNRVEIRTKLDDLPSINCFPGDLNQAISNIVENAIESITGNGTIDIQSSLVEPDDSMKCRHIRLFIRDSGCGIAKEYLDKVFDPFFTTKPVGEGQGLGLSIAYGIIKRHDGTIEITSQPGVGTTVTVRLPLRLDY